MFWILQAMKNKQKSQNALNNISELEARREHKPPPKHNPYELMLRTEH